MAIGKTRKTKLLPQSPKKSGHVPATVRHLHLVRQELKSDITTLRLETSAGFKKMDERFLKIDARFTSMEGRFDSIDARFERLESLILDMKALLEEQNARNRFVLDGYTSLYDKSKETDARLDRMETHIFGRSQK